MNGPVGEIAVPRVTEEAAQNSETERARILLVDDDERNLLALATVLEDLGEVVLAHSGEEALRHLLRGEFAVILLDVYMPGIDGYETAQIIRSREQTKGIPIVFLSAVNKETEHLMRGYSMGAVDYVFKPVDPIVLRSKATVFVDLFQKTKEVERKAAHEQALMDATIRANAERLRAEQELRRSEQRQAAIIQSLPMVLYLEPFDARDRGPTYVSGDLHAITGFTFEEVQGQPTIWNDRLHPEDRDSVIAAIDARKSNGRSSVEYRWLCADGSYRHFLDQAVLLKDNEGRPLEFAGTLTDITDQRSLESQLMQAQKMDAIGKLTGGIAHDFNNLLAAVIGGLGILEKRATLGDEEAKILGMTRRAAEQGSELVRRLLAFARRQTLEPKPVSIAALKESVSDLLTHTLGGLVSIEWEITKDIGNPFADRAQLELALLNLIINARDAMPDGGTITITADDRSVSSGEIAGLAPGNYVRLAVTDTGTGIATEYLEKVLEPFFTTKDVGKGSGLGLPMVYGFAKQSNGAFRIESRVGRGTTVELWLPEASEDGASRDVPKKSEAVAVDSDVRPLKILLVDDHPEVRTTTAALLEDLGHTVFEAANGGEALTALEDGASECDLLISDYAMPHLSGTEFVRRARQISPEIPALIITGYAESDAVRDRPEDVEILLKPFTPKALKGAIARICGEPAA